MRVGLLITLLAAALLILRPSFLVSADQKAYDALARRVFAGGLTGKVVIAKIDERSLRQFGRWPWSRDRIGLLVKKIADAGASAVAVDMVFPEADDANDVLLARSLAGRGVVVGYDFAFGPDQFGSTECLGAPLLGGQSTAVAAHEQTALFHASSVTCSVPKIGAAAVSGGFLNAAPDSDGLLRRIPVLIESHGAVYPNLALAALLAQEHAPAIVVSADSKGGVRALLGRTVLPLDERGRLLLRFRGAGGTFRSVPAVDILTSAAPLEEFRGKVVLVGASAPGLQDDVATAVDLSFPGVEVQATLADNILRGDFLMQPDWAPWLQLALAALVSLSGTFVFSRLSLLLGAAATLGLAIGVWFGSEELLSTTGFFFSPLIPISTCSASFVALTFANLRAEKKRAASMYLQLGSANMFMLHALELLTAIRDDETGDHLTRIQQYMGLLCRAAAANPRFSKILVAERVSMLVDLAPIHDIGKIGIPDRILKKPGPLTPEEYEEMKQHVTHGRRVLERARKKAGMQDETLFSLACEIVYCHHENWDGSGYPIGLRGDTIPLAGRLLAVADSYDALTSKRAYKKALPHAEAVETIALASGTRFDPDIVAAFLHTQDEWLAVSRKYRGDAGKSAGAGA